MKRGIGTLFIGMSALATGFITGLLLTPKSGRENRKWITEHSKETKDWLEEQGIKLKKDSEKRIDRVSKGIKKTVKDSVPDLYEATKELHLSEEEDLENG